MSRSKRVLGLVALAGGITLAGCAPVTFVPGGFGVATGPGMGLAISNCNALGPQTGVSAQMGIPSSAIQAGVIRNRIAALQSRFMLGSSSVRRDMSSWKRAATGECN